MTTRNLEKTFAVLITVVLIAVPSIAQPDAGGAADSAPKDAHELDALVAPIALYPDPLVAQILAASTFPDQIAVADYWVQQNKALSKQALMEAVNKQSWDASVKALTQFPSVLHNMAQNLNWTSTLGEAYHNQASEVMSAIQTLRAQAKAAGTLKSGPQITVTQESPQIISIEPANPQMVYVPQYNPAVIYGTPYVTPGYNAGDVALGALLGFGSGVAVGALGSGGCCGWGWGSWGTNWSGGAVVYNHNNFYGNTAWHGGYYNGAYHDGYGYHNAYDRAATTGRGYANRADWDRNLSHGMEGGRALDSDSWARADNAFRNSNAFSGFGHHFGGLGGFGGFGGWQSRAQSFRGWGSMRGGGFFGGRFGGGHFGGGGFHRGGFRR
jgi:hypothetical protein